MRRNLTASFQPEIFRSGVTLSVIRRKMIVASPVQCVMTSIGFAPRLSVSANQPSSASGVSDEIKIAVLRSLSFMALEILAQVHALIQRCDLIAVAVKGKRFALREFSDAALGRLAPARVIDLGVDVGKRFALREFSDAALGRLAPAR